MLAHVDADSFFASVLIRKHPQLRGKPVLALGMGGGCVIAASYEAKAKGVKTGMRLSDALKLIPDAIKLPSDFRETGLASDQIETIILENCPLFQKYSVDEWFLDLAAIVGGIPKDLDQWATFMRTDILRRTGLSVSVGIGPTKLLAKMASEYRKPGGVTVVDAVGAQNIARPRDNTQPMTIETFLRDRPIAAIPGIGHQRAIHAQINRWHTAWDFATANPAIVRAVFHRPGIELQRELLGERLSEVVTESALPKSVSRARSFAPIQDEETLWAHLLRHLEYTVLKMRRHELGCRGVSVWLRDTTYRNYKSTHASLPQSMSTDEDIRPYVERNFKNIFKPGNGYTQAGLTLWRLNPTAVQYSLFEDPEQTHERHALQASLDRLHERFGRDSITRGSALEISSGTRRGFEMPVINE